MRKPVLGRGLDAILGSARAVVDPVEPVAQEATVGEPLYVAVERISAGRAQPRRHFDEDALNELADSIRANGILQPLLVKPVNGRYVLIAACAGCGFATDLRGGSDRGL